MAALIDRRRHPRFLMPSAYTGAAVRRMAEHAMEDRFCREGHVLDLSEGGVRLEIDEPIAPGERVAVRVDLPAPGGEQRPLYAIGNVIWLDIASMGSSEVAVVFTTLCEEGDLERLRSHLSGGAYIRAA